jgi:hypothetical protein
MKQLTFKDRFDFIIANKADKVFKGCTEAQIVDELREAILKQTLLYKTNHEGNICGMILAVEYKHLKELFVQRNLAMNIETLREFAREAIRRWPEYKLTWHKHGILKQHNTQRFLKKLLA